MESTTEELEDNTLIIVLSASGDLVKKKTYPALFRLFRLGFLLNDINIVGYAHTKMDDTQHHKRIMAESNFIEEFKTISSYVSGTYDDKSFKNLDKFLNSIESQYRQKRDKVAHVYFRWH